VPTSPSAPFPRTDPDDAATRAGALVENVERVVRGRRAAVELVVCAVLAGGHALIEDVPGSGKTTLARAVARSIGGRFQRIQATADLLPADITGSAVWDPQRQVFDFAPGPLFAHVVLADELNRTTPRTQSAFLEAMEEGAVTVDGQRHPLPDPFVLIATQNPVEQHGTYPLPEGQLDRFAVRVHLGALDPAAERLVVREQLAGPTVADLGAVLGTGELRALRAHVRGVHVADAVLDHAVTLVRSTRHDGRIALGASSRAAITLVRCAQARAVLDGRTFVTPDDVRALTVPVLAHRLVLAYGLATGHRPEDVVAELVARVPVPVTG
jgi:MoxR-like ATPase